MVQLQAHTSRKRGFYSVFRWNKSVPNWVSSSELWRHRRVGTQRRQGSEGRLPGGGGISLGHVLEDEEENFKSKG